MPCWEHTDALDALCLGAAVPADARGRLLHTRGFVLGAPGQHGLRAQLCLAPY